MPVKIKVLDQGAGFLFYCTGRVTAVELIEAIKALVDKADAISFCDYVIIEYAEDAILAASPENLRMIADTVKLAGEINPDAAIAVIAASDSVYGLSRMWSVFVEDSSLRTRVFRHKSDAEKWLNEVIGWGDDQP